MRVLFFGSSDYCLPILETLNKNFSLVGIITREDKPVGRKKHIIPSAPKLFGNEANIPVFTPKNKSDLLNINIALRQLHPDIAVVADYGILIPAETFCIPKHQTINIHFSKLPEFRGAAPVQYTLLRGDTSAWITIQKLAEELDTGDILWQREEDIDPEDTTGSLYRKLFNSASKELSDVIKQYAEHTIIPQSQDNVLASYTRRLTRQDGFIPWNILNQIIEGKQVSEEQRGTWPLYTSILSNFQPLTSDVQHLIYNVFRAFSPWPGLWTLLRPPGFDGQAEIAIGKKRLKILKLRLEPTTRLVIDEVQMEGKQPVSWKQFQEANLSRAEIVGTGI